MAQETDLKRRILEEQLCDLEKDISAVSRQFSSTLNELDRERLQRHLDYLFEKHDDLRKKIDSINTSKNLGNEVSKFRLAEIDFKEAKEQISGKLDNLKNEGGFLGLIIEKCQIYQGDLLIDEIRHKFKDGKPNFKEIIIDASSKIWTNDKGWMLCIAEYLRLSPDEALLTPEILVDTIIKQCCPSRTFFFELRNWGHLGDSQAKLLAQFYDTFWMSLIAKQSQILSRATKTRFISVVSTKGSLDPRCFEIVCQSIKINLCEWDENEIRDWIMEYGCFPTTEEGAKEAGKIFKDSDGVPLSVYAELQKYFCFT
jgi:hypothetical protein